jgi:hypothetical protein
VYSPSRVAMPTRTSMRNLVTTLETG